MQNIQTPSGQPTRDDFDLIAEQDAAAIIGKSINTLRRWGVERKGPPRVKLGKSTFYRKTVLADWIDKQAIPTPEQKSSRGPRGSS